jgi:uncharacterized protein (DUF433 family)
MLLGVASGPFEIQPYGMIPSGRLEEDEGIDWGTSNVGGGAVVYYRPTFGRSFLVSHRLLWLDARRYHLSLWLSREEGLRAYSIPLVEAFHAAAESYPQISINPDVMAGAPCVQGTRIPVYKILGAIEDHGSLKGAIDSYPRLTLDQVIEAIGFAKLVVECPIEHGVSVKLLESSEAQARARLEKITALDADWSALGSAPPNEKAKELAFRVLNSSYSMGKLEPSLVTAAADGGVGVVYKSSDKYAAIECSNRGRMQLLWFDQDRVPRSRRIKNTDKAIREALEQIAALHANA